MTKRSASADKPARPKRVAGRAPARTKRSTARPPETTADDVAVRAYYLYLERGASGGNELDDWLRAERELIS